MHKTFTRRTALALALACGAFGAAQAQDTIKLAGIYELSGAGASAGTYFKDGVELAVKEINAAGGILGKKIVSTQADTQSQPGVAKGLATKAIDDGVFAVFGPVFSGSIMVSMNETRKAEVPNWTGGEAAAITAQLAGWDVDPKPMLTNTCYSFVDGKNVVHVASVHEYVEAEKTFKTVAGSGGVSMAASEVEGRYAWNWARTIWADALA